MGIEAVHMFALRCDLCGQRYRKTAANPIVLIQDAEDSDGWHPIYVSTHATCDNDCQCPLLAVEKLLCLGCAKTCAEAELAGMLSHD